MGKTRHKRCVPALSLANSFSEAECRLMKLKVYIIRYEKFYDKMINWPSLYFANISRSDFQFEEEDF